MNRYNTNLYLARLFSNSKHLAFKALICIILTCCSVTALYAANLGPGAAVPGGYALKIYKVNSALYPFVQAYFRTFDENQQPLVNLNERNIGLMVKGKSYDPFKRQFFIQSLRQRQEAIRVVLVLDASKSMQGKPFNKALEATGRFIDLKRPQDEIAVLAIRDTKEGYEVASSFERDKVVLAKRLADIKVDGLKTRLYDTVGAALQMCGLTAQGSLSPSPSDYIVSCAVVVFSDGRDEGSAISRGELNARITNLPIPIPIYSLAYSKINPEYFKNLEAISKNSFGIYYLVGESFEQMTRIVEQVQNVLQSDYVLTFRSYIDSDGEDHSFRIGVEYPTGSGKYYYEKARFEAIEPPPIGPIRELKNLLSEQLPRHPDDNPFYQPMQSPLGGAAQTTMPPGQ